MSYFVHQCCMRIFDMELLSSRLHMAKHRFSLLQAMEGFPWLEALISGPYLVCSCNLRDCPEYVAIQTCKALVGRSEWS
jgi:hypothetical protein